VTEDAPAPTKHPTPQAVVGGVFDLLFAAVFVLGAVAAWNLTLEEPLPVFIPGAMLLAGVNYLIAGVALLLPWRDAFLIGRAFLILGIVCNIALMVGGAARLPDEIVENYPFAIPVPSFIVGLTMLEAIVLFWPDGSQ